MYKSIDTWRWQHGKIRWWRWQNVILAFISWWIEYMVTEVMIELYNILVRLELEYCAQLSIGWTWLHWHDCIRNGGRDSSWRSMEWSISASVCFTTVVMFTISVKSFWLRAIQFKKNYTWLQSCYPQCKDKGSFLRRDWDYFLWSRDGCGMTWLRYTKLWGT